MLKATTSVARDCSSRQGRVNAPVFTLSITQPDHIFEKVLRKPFARDAVGLPCAYAIHGAYRSSAAIVTARRRAIVPFCTPPKKLGGVFAMIVGALIAAVVIGILFVIIGAILLVLKIIRRNEGGPVI